MIRCTRVRRSGGLHSSSVRSQEQINDQGDLLSHDVRHGHDQHPVRVRRCHRRHHRQQPKRMRSLLTAIHSHHLPPPIKRPLSKKDFLRSFSFSTRTMSIFASEAKPISFLSAPPSVTISIYQSRKKTKQQENIFLSADQKIST